jgi:hypothetical protein
MEKDNNTDLVERLRIEIKYEAYLNPKQVDEVSWRGEVGILISVNEAKIIVKMFDEMKAQHL